MPDASLAQAAHRRGNAPRRGGSRLKGISSSSHGQHNVISGGMFALPRNCDRVLRHGSCINAYEDCWKAAKWKNIEICRTQHWKRFLRSISKLNVSVKSEFVRFLWDHCELNMTSMRMRHLRSDRTSDESSWDEQNMDDCVDSRIGEDKGP